MLNNDLDKRAGWLVLGGSQLLNSHVRHQPFYPFIALSPEVSLSLHLETHLISSASEHSFLFLPSTHLNFEGKVVAVRSQAR